MQRLYAGLCRNRVGTLQSAPPSSVIGLSVAAEHHQDGNEQDVE